MPTLWHHHDANSEPSDQITVQIISETVPRQPSKDWHQANCPFGQSLRAEALARGKTMFGQFAALFTAMLPLSAHMTKFLLKFGL